MEAFKGLPRFFGPLLSLHSPKLASFLVLPVMLPLLKGHTHYKLSSVLGVTVLRTQVHIMPSGFGWIQLDTTRSIVDQMV